MGGGSGVRAGYAYELPVLNGPYARELLRKQEERGLFQMEVPFSEFEQAAYGNSASSREAMGLPRPPKYPRSSLSELSGTEGWNESAIKHLFLGEVKTNSKGELIASGFHYGQIRNNGNRIIRRRMTRTNEHGLYQANVVINGVRKKAYSTFFPREWSPQQVVNAVNAAARNGKRSGNDRVLGSYQGIKIVINYKQGKIASAYPIMEEK